MKNRISISILFILSGLLVVLIPTVLFPVCSAEKMKMACFFTKKAEIGLGVVIAAIGALYFFFKNEGVRLGLSLTQILLSALILLYPTKLIGICKSTDMACRVKTLPALIVVTVLIGVVSIGNSLYLAVFKKPE